MRFVILVFSQVVRILSRILSMLSAYGQCGVCDRCRSVRASVGYSMSSYCGVYGLLLSTWFGLLSLSWMMFMVSWSSAW